MGLRFFVLGPLEVRSGAETIEIRGAKRRVLLAYLLVHAGQPQPLDRVVDASAPKRTAKSPRRRSRPMCRSCASSSALLPDGGASLVHRSGGYLLEIAADALDST